MTLNKNVKIITIIFCSLIFIFIWLFTAFGAFGLPVRYSAGWGNCLGLGINNIIEANKKEVSLCYGFYQTMRASFDPVNYPTIINN